MESGEIAQHVAVQAFNLLGYEPTRERLSYSILATAWRTGFPKTSPEVGAEYDNPWARVPIQYHLEEAILFRFWAMQAEVKYGYLSKIMRMVEDEWSLSVKAAAIQPIHILRAMTMLLMDRAQKRAAAVNSPGTLTSEQVTETYNKHVLEYEALVSAAVQDETPIPTENLQLGLSRNHAWTRLLVFGSNNLLSTLGLEPQVTPVASIMLELATWQTQTGLFEAIRKLP